VVDVPPDSALLLVDVALATELGAAGRVGVAQVSLRFRACVQDDDRRRQHSERHLIT